MIENDNEIVLTLSKKIFFLKLAISLSMIIIPITLVKMILPDLNSNFSTTSGLIGVVIGNSIVNYFRIKKIKESIDDSEKYFNFRAEIILLIVTFGVIFLLSVYLEEIFIRGTLILLIIAGVWMIVDSSIKYFTRKPMIIINNYGIKIDINISYPKTNMLKWEEIEEVFIYDLNKYKAIGILPKNMNEILRNENRFRRYLIGNPKIFTVLKMHFPMDIEELYIEIKSHMNEKHSK